MPTPVAHTLAGAFLYLRSRGTRPTPVHWKWMAIYCFFAVLPDFDFIPGLIEGQPFLYHRGPTHSLGFVGLMSAIAALLGWAFRVRKTGRLVAACASGLLSHVLLDLVCWAEKGKSGVMAFWPLSNDAVHFPVSLFSTLQYSGFGSLFHWVNISVLFQEVITTTVLFVVAMAVNRSPEKNSKAAKPAPVLKKVETYE